jgi:hypothetical protein
MQRKRSMTSYTHIALFAIAAAGCAELESEELGESASELSAASWSPKVGLGGVGDVGATPGSVTGTSLIVRSGYWTKRTASGWAPPSWTATGHGFAVRASVAGFNGFIYMVNIDSHNGVYMARFDPSSSTWSQASLLPYQSYATPAIAAFQNQLWILGNTTDTYHQVWSATMTTDEVFSQPQLIDGKFSAERVSAAAFANRLYMAHAQLASDKIIYARFDGTTWTPNQFILAGQNGSAITGTEPGLAAVNGFLHIVYRNTSAAAVKWSYFDTCAWSPEVSIGTLTTAVGYGLAQGGPGLVLTTRVSDLMYVSEFTAPPAPRLPPTCSVASP